jgi:[ribosomal protein S5]-alanine N-acetyltransferase
MLTFDFSIFPLLTTERLSLRRITDADAEDIFLIRKDAGLMQYIFRPVAENVQDVHDLIGRINDGIRNNTSINWGITIKGNNTVIGVVGFVRSTPEHHRAEVGYILAQEHHRKGLMTEALAAVIGYGFREMKLHLAEAVIDPRNIPSRRVLEKLGFVQEAHFKENHFFNGQFFDSVHFSLLASRSSF